MVERKWRFRDDMLCQYVNGTSNLTFQDAENRLNYLEEKESMPDMREKISEYIGELDTEIKRLESSLEENMDAEACTVTAIEVKLQALTEVRNDLQSRLEEVI